MTQLLLSVVDLCCVRLANAAFQPVVGPIQALAPAKSEGSAAIASCLLELWAYGHISAVTLQRVADSCICVEIENFLSLHKRRFTVATVADCV